MCQQGVLVYVITTSSSATYSVTLVLHQLFFLECLHCFKVCQDCLTIVVVHAFGGILQLFLLDLSVE